jgi:hypothetical protein
MVLCTHEHEMVVQDLDCLYERRLDLFANNPFLSEACVVAVDPRYRCYQFPMLQQITLL